MKNKNTMVYKTTEKKLRGWIKQAYTKQNRLKAKYLEWYWRKIDGQDKVTLVVTAFTKLPEALS